MALQSVTGLALEQLGSIEGFREILDVNSGALPFQLPPQVQQGIDVANQVLDLTGIDFKIPTEADLSKGLSSVLGSLGDLDAQKTPDLAGVLEGDISAESLLQSISWLL